MKFIPSILKFLSAPILCTGASGLYFLLTLFLGAYTHAQDASNVEPPEVEAVPVMDERGVNVVSGKFTFPGPSLSIGNPSAGGLSVKYWFDPLGRTFDGYSGSKTGIYHLNGLSHSLEGAVTYSRGGDDLIVIIGQSTELFSSLHASRDGVFPPVGISGSTLRKGAASGSFIYTLADGSVAVFEHINNGSQYPIGSYIKSLTRPSGEKLEWDYEIASTPDKRPLVRTVTNNFGYQMRFETRNAPTIKHGVIAINNAVERCPPSAGVTTCQSLLAQNWPSLTFERPTIDQPLRFTDQSGGIWTIFSEGLTKPGGQYFDKFKFRLVSPGNNVTEVITSALKQYDCWEKGFGNYIQGTNCFDESWLYNPVLSVAINGDTWTYTYGHYNEIYTYTDPVVGPTFNVADTIVTDPQGNQTRYVRSKMHLHEKVDSLGLRTTYKWDRKWSWLPENCPDVAGLACTDEYRNPLASYRIKRVTSPEGNYTSYTYGNRANLTQVTKVAKPGSGLADITVSTNYDATCINSVTCNRPNYVINERGDRTDFTYDPVHGGVLTTTLPAPIPGGQRPQTRNTYTAHSARYLNPLDGNLINSTPIQLLSRSVTCPTSTTCGASQEISTSIGYGLTGGVSNLLPLSRSIGSTSLSSVTKFEYDRIGNITSLDGPRTDVVDVSNFTYDAHRRQVFAIEPDPDGVGSLRRTATRKSYDSEGKITSLSKGETTSSIGSDFVDLEKLDYEYDTRGNLIKTKSPARVVQYSYDVNRRLLCTATRMNPIFFGALPVDACTHSGAGANGQDRITQLNYDAAGRMTSEVRALGTTLQQTYVTVAYTPNGLRDWVEDANGNRTAYTYDGFDRLTKINFPWVTTGARTANPNDYEHYGYDAAGNRVSQRLRSGETIIFSFDALNRETLRDLPGGSALDVYFSYDLLGRRLSARHGSTSGQGVLYAYDDLSRVRSETAYGFTVTYDYDAASNRTRLGFPDANHVEYTYDATNRMDQVREKGATSGVGLLADYSYDRVGRRAGITRGGNTGASTSFLYDDTSRLVTLQQTLGGSNNQTLGFAYNPANQIIQRTATDDIHNWIPAALNYSRNGLNQYTSVGGISYSHDARGNLTRDGARNFSYDFENRLTNISGSTSLALAYDPLGRLRQTTSGATVTQFVYAGDQLVAEYSGTGAMLRRYVHGAGIDEPLVWYEGDSLVNRRWLIADHQGSIISEHDGSREVVKNRYGSYGEPQAWFGGRFRYTGQMALPEVELYHYKARVYNPSLGRFLQTDPVGYEDQMNLYTYVGNDPVNMMDPTGKTSTPFSMMRTDQRTREIARTDPAFASQATAYQGAGVAITAIAVAAAASPIAAVAVSIGVETGTIDVPVVTKGGGEKIFRNGSGTPTNMTPRANDTSGLSANNQPMPGKNQVIDTSKLNNLCATCDNAKTGHVSITPKDPSQMQGWIDSRGGGTVHPLTQELMDAIVDTVKK